MPRSILHAACVALVLALSLAAPARAEDDIKKLLSDLLQRIQNLEAEVATLRKQVEALPAAGASNAAGSAAGAVAADGSKQVMQVVRIEPVPVDESRREDIDKLRDEADQFDQQAVQLDSQRASLEDQRRGRSGQDRDYSSGGDSVGGQITSLRKQISQLRGQANRKRTDADRIEAELETKLQRVGGWDGTRIVILTTKKDLSDALTAINPGDFITWDGVRDRLTKDLDTFTITRITKAAAPEDFVPPPPNLKLPPPTPPVPPVP